jgi:hypothetical protein
MTFLEFASKNVLKLVLFNVIEPSLFVVIPISDRLTSSELKPLSGALKIEFSVD